MKKLTFLAIILLMILLTNALMTQTKAQYSTSPTITPTFSCVANIPCTSPEPTQDTSATLTPTIYNATPSQSETPAPTTEATPTLNPCENAQASTQSRGHKKHRKHSRHGNNGFFSKMIEELLKLIEELLKQLGLDSPIIIPTPTPQLTNGPTIQPTTDPCITTQPTNSQPTTAPTTQPTSSQPTVTTQPSATPAPTTPASGDVTFSDEFDGSANSSPDSTKWTAEVGAKLRNNEDQYYTPFSNKNVFLDGQGNLVIEARRESYNGSSFTSAAIESTYEQSYGRIEWRARMDSLQNGIWPALWTDGPNWPRGGELDMMEWFADPSNPTAQVNIHGSDTSTDYSWGGRDLTGIDITQWNVYSVEWRPTYIEFKVNGQQRAYTPSSAWLQGWTTAFQAPQTIIINIAMNNGGVSWMGSNARLLSSFTKARLYVDYVREYR